MASIKSPFPVSDLSIKDLVDISSMLKNIVASSFGPVCCPVLMTTSTGQVVFTSDGYTILSSLSLSHPAAKCILESVYSHSSVYGDGCKTVILYLSELLREIERNSCVLAGQTARTALRSNISSSLRKFIIEDIPLLCNDIINSVMNVQSLSEGANCQLKLFKQVAVTILNGSFPKDVVDHLGNLISELIFSSNVGKDQRNVLSLCFQNCLHIFPNNSYSDSHLRDGLFFNGLCCRQAMKYAKRSKFVITLCPFEEEGNGNKTEYCLKLPGKVNEDIMTHKKYSVETFLKRLKNMGVSLILTCQKVPVFVLHICNGFGIDVFSCVEQEDIEFISFYTGMSPVTSIHDELTINGAVLGEVDSYEKVMYSGKEMLKLTCTGKFPGWQAKCLFLHAPSNGLIQQLKLLVKKCFKTFSCLLEGSNKELTNLDSSSTIFKGCATWNEGKLPQVFYPGTPENEEHRMESVASNSLSSNIICGGGYFEFLFSYLMEKKFDKSSPPLKKMWANIVVKMLQSVPQTLFSNLSPKKVHQASSFIMAREEAKKYLQENKHFSFNSKGVLCSDADSEVVEILNVKVASLYAALDLAVTLLKIDAVVGVKKLPEDAT
ncbi:thermosome subunit [Elysia marginata]|uniref:Thermosome subunit n=1 Tax=Elysia marginata TaxID=1093978 RepID=A0AAV4GEJ1_9GAST|nr:thermosome subunit [Elysia marginata]